ncbi:SNF2 helicase associated domain-containing protein, partial [Clostridium sp.]|uniref:SNF2 helicase associated domain-containing protein n=1 Tax=Clostridium sp. TaxID=1506 RepID=UPI003F396775
MDIRKLIVRLQENVISNKLRKGKELADIGKVLDLNFEDFIDNRDMKRIKVSALVKAEEKFDIYNVKMLIGVDRGRIVQTSCECIDYHTNNSWAGNYICKHVAAAYYVFIDELIKELEEEKEDSYLEKTGGNLLEDINDIFSPKEGLKLEVNLNKKAVYRLEFFEADFKIGNKRMYVLKNLRDFASARIKNTPLEYGKDFKYNPKTHEFDERDEKIAEFIEDFVLTKGLLVDQSNGLNIGSSKYLKIPITSLRRFLEVVSHKKINYGGDTVRIFKEDMPIEMKVSNEEEYYALSILTKDFKPLSERWDAFLFDNNIYLPSKKQIDTLKVLSKNIGEREKALFKKENGEKFFNDVVSILKDVCKEVEYDKTIDIIEGRDLKAEFYFDENRKNILLYCKLIYGDEEVDLLSEESTGKIIIRNKNKEIDILKEIQELKFLVQGDKLLFNGEEEDLYNLLTKGYRNLEKYGEVFYSDRFKNRKVYEAPSIEGEFKENNDGYLDFSFEIAEVNPKEYKHILESFRNKKKFHKLKDDSFINLEDNKLKEILGVIDKVVYKEKEINNIRVHKNRSFLINEFLNKKDLSFIKGKDIVQKTVTKIENLNNNLFQIPEELNATLREYQITGFNWFKNLSFLGFGGVLADEMGLGKTLQAISFILSEKDKKTLIVAPTSLIYNWKNEFKKFAPTIKVAIVHGNKEERDETIKNYKDYDVILTTYGTLRNDEE